MHEKTLRMKRESLRSKLRHDALKHVREEWQQAQAVEDIDRQIQGQDFDTNSRHTSRKAPPIGSAQQRMFETLTGPLPHDPQAIIHRRADAINALVAYCTVEEPATNFLTNKYLKRSQKQSRKRAPATASASSLEEQRKLLRDSVYVKTMGRGNVRKCYVCVGKAMTLQPNDPKHADLVRDFGFRHTLLTHFTNIHLSRILENESSTCPLCELKLEDKMYLQNHSESVHDLRTERTRFAKYW